MLPSQLWSGSSSQLSSTFVRGLGSVSEISYLPNQLTSSRRKITSFRPLTCSGGRNQRWTALLIMQKPAGQHTLARHSPHSPPSTRSEFKCLNCHIKYAQCGNYLCRTLCVFSLMPTAISCRSVDASRYVWSGGAESRRGGWWRPGKCWRWDRKQRVFQGTASNQEPQCLFSDQGGREAADRNHFSYFKTLNSQLQMCTYGFHADGKWRPVCERLCCTVPALWQLMNEPKSGSSPWAQVIYSLIE